MEIIVLFGGKSAEHDISILTATAIMQKIQYDRHSVTPVYIDRQGHWFKGANMTEKPDAQANFQLDQVGQAIVPTDVLREGTDQIVFPALRRDHSRFIRKFKCGLRWCRRLSVVGWYG